LGGCERLAGAAEIPAPRDGEGQGKPRVRGCIEAAGSVSAPPRETTALDELGQHGQRASRRSLPAATQQSAHTPRAFSRDTGVAMHALDPKPRDRLWRVSLEMLGG
jgi:hypothetical protein